MAYMVIELCVVVCMWLCHIYVYVFIFIQYILICINMYIDVHEYGMNMAMHNEGYIYILHNVLTVIYIYILHNVLTLQISILNILANNGFILNKLVSMFNTTNCCTKMIQFAGIRKSAPAVSINAGSKTCTMGNSWAFFQNGFVIVVHA